MTNEQKLREIAYKHAEPKVIWNDGNMSIYPDEEKIESLLSDLTALISEHYVSKDEHEKMKHNLTHCGSCGDPLSRDCPRCKHLWET